MTLTFSQEQAVQRVIAILQKADRGLSILDINESAIRQSAVDRTNKPNELFYATDDVVIHRCETYFK